MSLAGAAVFGSLAALTTIVLPANIQPAFPLLTFLRFDPAELFDVLAFLIFGPIPGLITATVHWAILAETGTNGILGPTGKFAAVLSTLFGLWLGSMAYRRFALRAANASVALGTMLGFAALTRVGLMLVVNYFIFTYIGPVIFGINYLGFSQSALAAVGIRYAEFYTGALGDALLHEHLQRITRGLLRDNPIYDFHALDLEGPRNSLWAPLD